MHGEAVLVVEGEEFKVHPYPLTVASEVFRRMFSSQMREAREARVVLHGKSKEEFREVLRFLDVGALISGRVPHIGPGNVEMLLRWADEYAMDSLRDRCEQYLLTEEPDVRGLRVAIQFGLRDRREQCLEAVTQDLRRHLPGVGAHLAEPEIMALLWPAIFAEAGLQLPPQDRLDELGATPGPLATLWPFVALVLSGGTPLAAAAAAFRRGFTVRVTAAEPRVSWVAPDGQQGRGGGRSRSRRRRRRRRCRYQSTSPSSRTSSSSG